MARGAITNIFTSRPSHHSSSKSKDLDFCNQPHRFSIRTMTADAVRDTRPWLSSLRSALRVLIIVLSGAVVGTLIHTLEIYRGNRYLDLRSGELPMTWPARTNLAPTLVLFIIAGVNFLASVAIMAMAVKRSFRRPIRSRDCYRVAAGSMGVVLWATALIVYKFIERRSKASLGRYSCIHRNTMSNGRYQYRAVCSEQGLAFYLASGAACAEAVTLFTLAITALQSAKRHTTIQLAEEKTKRPYP